MNKEKVFLLAKEAGFTTSSYWPGELFGTAHCGNINKEINKFKNLLIDEVIKALEEIHCANVVDDGSISSVHAIGENHGIRAAIKAIEAMK